MGEHVDHDVRTPSSEKRQRLRRRFTIRQRERSAAPFPPPEQHERDDAPGDEGVQGTRDRISPERLPQPHVADGSRSSPCGGKREDETIREVRKNRAEDQPPYPGTTSKWKPCPEGVGIDGHPGRFGCRPRT